MSRCARRNHQRILFWLLLVTVTCEHVTATIRNDRPVTSMDQWYSIWGETAWQRPQQSVTRSNTFRLCWAVPRRARNVKVSSLCLVLRRTFNQCKMHQCIWNLVLDAADVRTDEPPRSGLKWIFGCTSQHQVAAAKGMIYGSNTGVQSPTFSRLKKYFVWEYKDIRRV